MAVIPLNAGAKLLPDGTQATGARFSVERVLSAGGFGITYLARDEQFDDTCVVKELAMGELVGRDTTGGTLQPLPGRQADVAYWVDKVVREARLLNRVRHEAVVTVRAAWQERGTAYYAMDHIDGMEFPSRQTEGWTWNHCEPLFRRMLEGLQAIHAAGLMGPETFKGIRGVYFDGDMNAAPALAGQSAGLVHAVKPVQQIIDETVAEFHAITARLGARAAAASF